MLTTIKRYFWVIFIVLLPACGSGVTTIAPTEVDVNAISTQAVMTAAAQMTQVAALSSTPFPTKPLIFKPTQTYLPTETQLPTFTVKGLRAAYTVKGNVYIHNSGEQPTQLTNSGIDHAVHLSDDGQKIVFYRGKFIDENKVYSINADGSKEQAVVNSDLLTALGLGYDKSTEIHDLALAPGTQQVIFDTHQLLGTKAGDPRPRPNNDLLVVDTDSKKIIRLLPPGQAGYFNVSPNGKLIAVQTADHIDIINLKGQVIHSNLVKYPKDDDHVWVPLFWTGDSNQLIVLLPLPSNENLDNSGWPLLRSAWKYSLNGSKPVETRLEPAPMGQAFGTSPDGNWIAYTYYISAKTGGDGKFGIYLGNLRTGASQMLYPIPVESNELPTVYYWNPESTHFIVEGYSMQSYIGDIHGKFMLLDGGLFAGWLDNHHYLYGILVMGETDRDADVSILQQIPEGFTFQDLAPTAFVFMNPK